MEAAGAARRARRCCSSESRNPCIQTRPHQRVRTQAVSGGGARAPQSRRPRTAGGEAEARADEKSDDGAKNNQRFHSMSDGCLANRLPAGKKRVAKWKICPESKAFHRKQKFRRRAAEFSGNFLPRAEETKAAICAEHEVPQFHPAGFLVQVREDQILRLAGFKRAPLRQQRGRFIRGVQHQMHARRRQGRQLIAQRGERRFVGNFHARQIHEIGDRGRVTGDG